MSRKIETASLSEVNSSVKVPQKKGWFKTLVAFNSFGSNFANSKFVVPPLIIITWPSVIKESAFFPMISFLSAFTTTELKNPIGFSPIGIAPPYTFSSNPFLFNSFSVLQTSLLIKF